MNHNWDIIGDKIFGILRGRGYRLQMFDKGGDKTMDPHDATRFFATIPSHDPNLDSFNILISLHDEDTNSHMDIKTPDLADDQDFNTVVKLKDSLQNNIGDRENLSVNWYKFDHDIDPKEDAVNNIQESRDISKPYGSTKSSYQQIGNSKLIIRHTDPVNEEKQGSRWRHIKNIFIETKLGERFNYPHPHIAGARAMARHLANEGRYNDQTAKAILKMSEDFIKLKKANKLMRGKDADLSLQVKGALEQLAKESKRLSGSKGYATGIANLARATQNAPAERVIALRNSLAETCGCQQDDDGALGSLEAAARYLISNGYEVKPAEPEIEYNQTHTVGEEPIDIEILRLEELAGII